MTGPQSARKGDPRLAPQWAPRWALTTATLLGAAYLLAVWLESAVASVPEALLPRPVHFFVQVADLFPRAAEGIIEWRARGYRCDRKHFEEIDVRPFFPIRRDDKENRFSRAMYFYHRQPAVLEALDGFLTSAQNRLTPQARIGGVMLLSLRLPIPPLGSTPDRYQPLPIERYPRSVERKWWYITPADVRAQRCAEAP